MMILLDVLFLCCMYYFAGVGAYQNYAPRLEGYVTQSRHINSQPSMPPAFTENPPSYEDAMRQANTNYSTGILNMVGS